MLKTNTFERLLITIEWSREGVAIIMHAGMCASWLSWPYDTFNDSCTCKHMHAQNFYVCIWSHVVPLETWSSKTSPGLTCKLPTHLQAAVMENKQGYGKNVCFEIAAQSSREASLLICVHQSSVGLWSDNIQTHGLHFHFYILYSNNQTSRTCNEHQQCTVSSQKWL